MLYVLVVNITFLIFIPLIPIILIIHCFKGEQTKKEEENKSEKQATETPKIPEPPENKRTLLIDVPFDTKWSPTRFQVFYVDREPNHANREFIESHYDEIKQFFASKFSEKYFNIEYDNNCEFVYLPLADNDTIKRIFPDIDTQGLDKTDFAEKFYSKFFEDHYIWNCFELPKTVAGFICLEKGKFEEHYEQDTPKYSFRYYPFDITSGDNIYYALHNFLSEIKSALDKPERIFWDSEKTDSQRIYIPYDPDLNPDKYQIIYIEKEFDEHNNKIISDNYEALCKLVKTEHVYDYYESNYKGKLRLFYLPKLITKDYLEEKTRRINPNSSAVASETIVKKIISDFYSRFFNDYQQNNKHELSDNGYFVRFKGGKFIGHNDEKGDIGWPVFSFSFQPINCNTYKEMVEELRNYLHNIGEDGTLYSSKGENYNPEDEHDPKTADLYFNIEAQKLIDEIAERLKKLQLMGISSQIISNMLLEPPKLSRLHITADYKILLPDYDKEIKMTPLPKTIFFFYLRHPEGLAFKELVDYRNELLEIYRDLTHFDDNSKIEESINNIVDSTKNSINEKCSRIREAFISEFDENIANNYIITSIKYKQRIPKCDQTPAEEEKIWLENMKKLITLDRSLIDDDSGIMKK